MSNLSGRTPVTIANDVTRKHLLMNDDGVIVKAILYDTGQCVNYFGPIPTDIENGYYRLDSSGKLFIDYELRKEFENALGHVITDVEGNTFPNRSRMTLVGVTIEDDPFNDSTKILIKGIGDMIPPEYQIYKGFDQIKSLKRKEVIEAGELYQLPPRVHHEVGKRELDVTIDEIREPFEEVDGQHVKFKRDIMPNEKIVFTRSIFSRMVGGIEIDTNTLMGDGTILVYNAATNMMEYSDELHVLNQKLVDADIKVETIKGELETSISELSQEMDTKLDNLDEKITEEINTKVTDLGLVVAQDLLNLDEKITTETDAKIVTVNQTIATLDGKVDTLASKTEQDLIGLKNEITSETDAKIVTVNQTISTLDGKVDSLADKTEQDLLDLDEKVTTETDAKIVTVNQTISTLDGKVDSLATKVEDDLLDLDNKVTTETDAKIVTVNQSISTLGQSLESTNQVVEGLGNSVGQISQDLNDTNDAVVQISQNLTQTNQNLSTTNQNLTTTNQNVSQLQTLMNDLSNEIIGVNILINGIITDIES